MEDTDEPRDFSLPKVLANHVLGKLACIIVFEFQSKTADENPTKIQWNGFVYKLIPSKQIWIIVTWAHAVHYSEEEGQILTRDYPSKGYAYFLRPTESRPLKMDVAVVKIHPKYYDGLSVAMFGCDLAVVVCKSIEENTEKFKKLEELLDVGIPMNQVDFRADMKVELIGMHDGDPEKAEVIEIEIKESDKSGLNMVYGPWRTKGFSGSALVCKTETSYSIVGIQSRVYFARGWCLSSVRFWWQTKYNTVGCNSQNQSTKYKGRKNTKR